MELIVISDTKIKLTLSKKELSCYSENTKEMLKEIMDDVREKCGCHKLNGRVYVQMYTSRAGGCEMFLTKLREREEVRNTDIMGEKCVVTEYRKYLYDEKDSQCIYLFEKLEYLLLCCKELAKGKYSGKSSFYVNREKNEFYLILDSETYIAGENLGKIRSMRELCYIKEHCDLLLDNNAVEKLAVFA